MIEVILWVTLSVLVLVALWLVRDVSRRNRKIGSFIDDRIERIGPRNFVGRALIRLFNRPRPLDPEEDSESMIVKAPQARRKPPPTASSLSASSLGRPKPQMSSVHVVNSDDLGADEYEDGSDEETCETNLPMPQANLIKPISTKKIQGYSYRRGVDIIVPIMRKLSQAYLEQMYEQQHTRATVSGPQATTNAKHIPWTNQRDRELVLGNSILSPFALLDLLVQLAGLADVNTHKVLLAAIDCPVDRVSKQFQLSRYQLFINHIANRVTKEVSSDDVDDDNYGNTLMWLPKVNSQVTPGTLRSDIIKDMKALYPSTVISDREITESGVWTVAEEALDWWYGDGGQTASYMTQRALAELTAPIIQHPPSQLGMFLLQNSTLVIDFGNRNLVEQQQPKSRLVPQRIPAITTDPLPTPRIRKANFLFRDHIEPRTNESTGVPEGLLIKQLLPLFTHRIIPYARFFHCYYHKNSVYPDLVGNEKRYTTFALEVPLARTGCFMRILMPYAIGLFDLTPQQVTNTFFDWDAICEQNKVDIIENQPVWFPNLNFSTPTFDLRQLLQQLNLKSCFQANEGNFSRLITKDPVSELPLRSVWIQNCGQVTTLHTSEKASPPPVKDARPLKKTDKVPDAATISHAFYFEVVYRLALSDDGPFSGYTIPLHIGYITDPVAVYDYEPKEERDNDDDGNQNTGETD